MNHRDELLRELAKQLDISPSDYRLAQQRFGAVKDWLLRGAYQSGAMPDVYLQGSFRLGTVIRPYRQGDDADFDIDQVCELTRPNPPRDAARLKNDLGNHLKLNGDYARMLDNEGNRCWTLNYASEAGRPGFHLDILPALPSENRIGSQIDITDRTSGYYEWSDSNPKDYYYWFKSKNHIDATVDRQQRQVILESNQGVFENFDDVPKQLVRTSLQKAIQLMKRHRDVRFSGRDDAPISIIITTLSAQVVHRDSVSKIIEEFVTYVCDRHTTLIQHGALAPDNKLDWVNGVWSVPNPVYLGVQGHGGENFADKWNNDSRLPSAFFEWVYCLRRDLAAFDLSGNSKELRLVSSHLGSDDVFATIRKQEIAEELGKDDGSSQATEPLLDLIHQAIEGHTDWLEVQELAKSIYHSSPDGSAIKDIAMVNYYQTVRHQGDRLSDTGLRDIQSVRARHPDCAAFRMCCNLLLEEASRQDVLDCLNERQGSDVLAWPILRLYPRSLLMA